MPVFTAPARDPKNNGSRTSAHKRKSWGQTRL